MSSPDWFELLTGFKEQDYQRTRSNLQVEGSRLRSLANGCEYEIGTLEIVSLRTLRSRIASNEDSGSRLRVSIVQADVRALHRDPQYRGALFQVASQFNLLEMVSPDITPEHGVTRYQYDRTQGPACAIAAGAATVYRNYFAPVGIEHLGQTADRQIDTLDEMGQALSNALSVPHSALWNMKNGYALATLEGLKLITAHLTGLSAKDRDALKSLLNFGLHREVEVTDLPEIEGHRVSQLFCSALPVAYSPIAPMQWEPFARLILEAAYEATLLAAMDNARRGGSNIVLLTQLGGGAFGNADTWISDAISHALSRMADRDLDVRLVSFGPPAPILRAIEQAFSNPTESGEVA